MSRCLKPSSSTSPCGKNESMSDLMTWWRSVVACLFYLLYLFIYIFL